MRIADMFKRKPIRGWVDIDMSQQIPDRGRLHDLTARMWGRNYNILSVMDQGKRLELAVWMTPSPACGDYLLLRDGDRSTRYRIRSLDYCWGVDDMLMLVVDFAPRKAIAEIDYDVSNMSYRAKLADGRRISVVREDLAHYILPEGAHP